MSKKIIVIPFIVAFLFIAGYFLTRTQEPTVESILVGKEDFDAFLLSTTPLDQTVEGERALLPEITEIERWEQVGNNISEDQNFAPGIVALREGGYRIFWNDYLDKVISSATSLDGLTFVKDEGFRLGKIGDGTDCFASHPWLVALEEGYRIFYQEACLSKDQTRPSRIYSAFSDNGTEFTPEGIVVDVGKKTGLTYAGHGRILQLADDSLRMYFSANTDTMSEREPSAILGAVSVDDGKTWILDDAITLQMGHDPAVIWQKEEVHMYTSFLSKNMLHLVSRDGGYTFTPVAWIEFYDSTGRYFEEFGDVEAIMLNEEVLIYGGGKLKGESIGSPGLIIMKEAR